MKMNGFAVLGAAALTLAASQATAGALGAPNEIFVGGATAVQETFHLDIMLRFCNYDGNVNDNDGVITPEIYVDDALVLPGNGDGNAALPAMNHRNQQVIHCNFKQTLGGALAGARVAVYKYNGGSGTGVAPVSQPEITPELDKRYMDASPTACTQVIPTTNPGPANTFLSIDGQTRFKFYRCGTPGTGAGAPIVIQDPDGGISDVEPKVFVGELATGFGLSVPGVPVDKPQNDFIDRGNLIVKAGPGIVFGVAATLPLYDQLLDYQQANGLLPGCPANPTRAQRDSLACMPSFPTAMVQSLYSGEISNWTTRSIYGQILNPVAAGVNQGNKVNLCRRTAGSGTHAQFMVNFFRTNCINGTPTIRTFANNVPPPVPAPQVYENEGSSGVDSCLAALANGSGFNGGFPNGLDVFPAAPSGSGNSSVVPRNRTAFALGYNSLERNASLNRPFRFMKIDGFAPTLENAFNNLYHDIYYLSYQNRVDANGDPDMRLGAIRTVAPTAAQRAVLKSFFATWNSPSPAAVDAVNDGLIVNPDGIANNGDEWQGGLLQPSRQAPQVFSAGPDPLKNDPRTPWARETPSGAADSCQELTYSNQ